MFRSAPAVRVVEVSSDGSIHSWRGASEREAGERLLAPSEEPELSQEAGALLRALCRSEVKWGQQGDLGRREQQQQ